MPLSFDASARYRLHDRVALRLERFGALAYHYDTRRLNFLHAHELATLVESFPAHGSAQAAFDASGIDPGRWPSFAAALEALAGSGFLVRDDAQETDDPQSLAKAGSPGGSEGDRAIAAEGKAGIAGESGNRVTVHESETRA